MWVSQCFSHILSPELSFKLYLFVQITHIHTNTFHGNTLFIQRDSEESHDDFFKSVSHNICVANFRPMIYINYLHQLDNYSRLSLSRSRRDPLKHCEISVLRHIRCAELRKIPIEQPNFTNEHVI